MLVLDDRLAIGFTGGPQYSTSVVPLSGGRERRNSTWPLPRRGRPVGPMGKLLDLMAS